MPLRMVEGSKAQLAGETNPTVSPVDNRGGFSSFKLAAGVLKGRKNRALAAESADILPTN